MSPLGFPFPPEGLPQGPDSGLTQGELPRPAPVSRSRTSLTRLSSRPGKLGAKDLVVGECSNCTSLTRPGAEPGKPGAEVQRLKGAEAQGKEGV